MGYVRGFVHGSVVGAVVGICVAPQPGPKTRQQLAAFGVAARDGYQVAERTVRRVVPFASAAADIARYLTPFKASGISAMMISALKITADRIAEGAVHIHNETNGRR